MFIRFFWDSDAKSDIEIDKQKKSTNMIFCFRRPIVCQAKSFNKFRLNLFSEMISAFTFSKRETKRERGKTNIRKIFQKRAFFCSNRIDQ
ncbi:hypothetical protein BpHYR1_012843 [Brachionus plicatilis]|uniref:Uncharacterized protein n=1 Tax=Brachionus plicatilis TaxID=10195 RepID=A0A3M7S5N4_BRAPC|nr:hypothetical protein BpHYR1_012843 [Brachionus plicatilis]